MTLTTQLKELQEALEIADGWRPFGDALAIYLKGNECPVGKAKRNLPSLITQVEALEAMQAAKEAGLAGGITVDHRKIGCLIHDNIDLSKRKHEIVLAIYDAIKPYLMEDSNHAD